LFQNLNGKSYVVAFAEKMAKEFEGTREGLNDLFAVRQPQLALVA